MDGSARVAEVLGSAGERLVQEAFGTTARAQRFYDTQLLDHLNEVMRTFISRQEMMFLATADADGRCDATLRAGPPGFVAVLSDRRVAWPEYRGNGVMASLGNVAVNAHAGVLFLDFFRDLIGLHVNGRARIVDDESLRRDHPDLPRESAPGRRAARWVLLDVEEAYVHCRKHIPRLMKVPAEGTRGAADVRRTAGDYFNVAAAKLAGTSAANEGDPTAPAGISPPARRRWWHRPRLWQPSRSRTPGGGVPRAR